MMRSDKDPCTQNVSLYAAVQILIVRSVFILLSFLLSEPLNVQYWAFNLVLFYLELIYWASPVFFLLKYPHVYLFTHFCFCGPCSPLLCIYFTKQLYFIHPLCSLSHQYWLTNPNLNGMFSSKPESRNFQLNPVRLWTWKVGAAGG